MKSTLEILETLIVNTTDGKYDWNKSEYKNGVFSYKKDNLEVIIKKNLITYSLVFYDKNVLIRTIEIVIGTPHYWKVQELILKILPQTQDNFADIENFL